MLGEVARTTGVRFEVVPQDAKPGLLGMNLWAVADRRNESRRVSDEDGKPMIFRSFTDAAEWANSHG